MYADVEWNSSMRFVLFSERSTGENRSMKKKRKRKSWAQTMMNRRIPRTIRKVRCDYDIVCVLIGTSTIRKVHYIDMGKQCQKVCCLLGYWYDTVSIER